MTSSALSQLKDRSHGETDPLAQVSRISKSSREKAGERKIQRDPTLLVGVGAGGRWVTNS